MINKINSSILKYFKDNIPSDYEVTVRSKILKESEMKAIKSPQDKQYLSDKNDCPTLPILLVYYVSHVSNVDDIGGGYYNKLITYNLDLLTYSEANALNIISYIEENLLINKNIELYDLDNTSLDIKCLVGSDIEWTRVEDEVLIQYCRDDIVEIMGSITIDLTYQKGEL